MESPYNPNGSYYGIEGIISRNGQILGKMGHTERYEDPWGREESDTTEQLHFHFSLSCTGEGNGNPLHYSCLENPRDGSLVGHCLWGRTESDTTDVT